VQCALLAADRCLESPRPDPKYGPPVIAILTVGQPNVSSTYSNPSAAWVNPQNLQPYAAVSVLERIGLVLLQWPGAIFTSSDWPLRPRVMMR